MFKRKRGTGRKRVILIVGSGLAGATLAVRLSRLGIGCKLLDKTAFDAPLPRDGRTIAVTYGSKRFLEACGLWEKLEPSARPIEKIRVLEYGSAWTVDYDSAEIGTDPMGHIVEFDILREALLTELRQAPNVEILSPTTITKIVQTRDRVTLLTKERGEIAGSLLIGADGKNSFVRSQINVKSQTEEYGHKALVAHFTHEKPHDNSAWEIFRKEGPFATLPMRDGENGEPQSGVVWCEAKNTPWDDIPDATLEREFEEIFPYYGKVKLNSKRWTFPITCLTTDKIFDTRALLIGDAAHALHPVAGQGINLGWRDAGVLADMLAEAKSLGQDYGSLVFLRSFSRKRALDHKGLFLFTHFTVKLFAIDNPLASLARQTGFALVNKVPPLKRFFMKKAMNGIR